MSRTGAQEVQFSKTEAKREKGSSPGAAAGSGPCGCGGALRGPAAGARLWGGRGRRRLARPGPGMRLGAPRGCHRQGFAPYPWLCMLRPWEAMSAEGRNLPRLPGGRKDGLFVCRAGTGRFSREESENESCAGGLSLPEGIKNHTHR